MEQAALPTAVDIITLLRLFTFALFFGMAMSMVGEKANPLKSLIEQGNDTMMKLVGIVMAYAPIGVAALMAWVAGAIGFSILIPLATYLVGVILGVFLHGVISYSLIVAAVDGVSPSRFYRNAIDFMLVAFTTCSSAAALPTNMDRAERKMGVPRSLYGFTLPLGCTINVDGTGIYMGVATVLIAQFHGIALTIEQQFVAILTATLASIGAAGVPGTGLVMMSMVLTAIGLPLEGIAIIAGVDRIAGMFRTTLNVTGDAACTVAVARTEGMLDREVFYGRKEAPEPGVAPTPQLA